MLRAIGVRVREGLHDPHVVAARPAAGRLRGVPRGRLRRLPRVGHREPRCRGQRRQHAAAARPEPGPAALQLRLVDRLRVPRAARRPGGHERVPAQDADADVPRGAASQRRARREVRVRAHRGRGTRRGRLRDLGRHRRRRARGVRPRDRASARATRGRSSGAACWRWRSGRRSASASARSCRTRWRPSSIVIAFTQFVEPILRLAASLNDVTATIGQFLPGAASDALVGASFYSIASVGAAESLEWWQGGLVLLAIGVVATLIGGATTWRRDVQ